MFCDIGIPLQAILRMHKFNLSQIIITMKESMKNEKKTYVAPSVETIEVNIEQGFSASDGSTVEKINQRNLEMEW